MTSETRVMVEPKDITGIEIECSHCRVRILLPISELHRMISSDCLSCGKRIFDNATDLQTGRDLYPALDHLNALFSAVRFLSALDRTDIHARIKLSISDMRLTPSASRT